MRKNGTLKGTFAPDLHTYYWLEAADHPTTIKPEATLEAERAANTKSIIGRNKSYDTEFLS
jgi:hypothetical protein